MTAREDLAATEKEITRLKEELAQLAVEMSEEPDVDFKPDFQAENARQVSIREAALVVANGTRTRLLADLDREEAERKIVRLEEDRAEAKRQARFTRWIAVAGLLLAALKILYDIWK